ncbi:ABC transporter ATP-binding protein [Clostridium sp. LCP25S3_F10]|uniref:ABC transporter ATP-binding protein n=1 Tax=Clostridium sp. LCP25S3_F10 TaxID=3438750 RepID=UPI003F911F57
MNSRSGMNKNSAFYLSMILNVIEGLLSGYNFIILYSIMDALINKSLNEKLLFNLAGLLALVFLVRIVVYSIGYTKGQIGGAKISRRIRLFLGDKMKKIPLVKFNKNQTGEYINAATASINNYENILTHKSGDIVKNITMLLLVVIFVGKMFLPAGIIILIANLLLIPALALSFYSVKKYGNDKNIVMTENVSNIVEYITGIQTFRAYGIGGTKNKTVTESMKNYSNVSYMYEKKVIPIGMIFYILSWFSLPFIIYVAGHAWIEGNLDTTSFFMVSIIPIFTCKLFTTIFVDLTSYKNLMISKRQILKVMNEEEEKENNSQFIPSDYSIEFKNVDFSYIKGEKVLKKVSFKAENKKLTAIVGGSGSGKSTILNLISKYYIQDSGDIKIGGISITDVLSVKVLDKVSMVDQDVFLFNDTIRNNIRYARASATDEEIEQSCRLANCHGFILKMEDGYNTIVGENGNRLSGGERQRISIARAILKNSPILLLDEATSSLDIENELAVKGAIKNLLKANKTVIMIAHTLSIIKNADEILVVDNGKIVESGTSDELIKQNGKFASMWRAEKKLNNGLENNLYGK